MEDRGLSLDRMRIVVRCRSLILYDRYPTR